MIIVYKENEARRSRVWYKYETQRSEEREGVRNQLDARKDK